MESMERMWFLQWKTNGFGAATCAICFPRKNFRRNNHSQEKQGAQVSSFCGLHFRADFSKKSLRRAMGSPTCWFRPCNLQVARHSVSPRGTSRGFNGNSMIFAWENGWFRGRDLCDSFPQKEFLGGKIILRKTSQQVSGLYGPHFRGDVSHKSLRRAMGSPTCWFKP